MEAKKRNNNNNNNNNWESTQSEQEDMMITMDLRRGPWTVDEDLTLINYIATHGEGRWNSLARCAGLKRTGKSCRLRWLNYLRPDVRRGNITLEEQLLILELHSQWGNRWSKIAQYLPGRTDNEIKNYWRTRVQKHAKQLKCDVNSKQFKDTMRYLWMPRLVERIQAAAATSSSGTTTSTVVATGHPTTLPPLHNDLPIMSHALGNSNLTPENSGNSSDSFAAQVSPVSDLADYYNSFPAISQSMNNNNIREDNYSHNDQVGHLDLLTSPYGYSDQFQANVAQNNQWYPDGDIMDNFLNADDMYFIQQQLNNIDV